ENRGPSTTFLRAIPMSHQRWPHANKSSRPLPTRPLRLPLLGERARVRANLFLETSLIISAPQTRTSQTLSPPPPNLNNPKIFSPLPAALPLSSLPSGN